MPTRRISLYDTLLRDGTQAEDISFTVEDKVRIAEKLDDLGIDYIEGGWPGSNPKDIAFFEEIRRRKPARAKITAFGSTRRSGMSCEKDPSMRQLLGAETPVATIFGKSWDLHVRDVLKVSIEENVEIIHDSVAYLKKNFDEVIYDAEHFFDGFRADPDYALRTLRAAEEAGADWIVLCDTNGGCLSGEITAGVKRARKCVKTRLGIHAHNDAGVGVANSLAAVEAGVEQVQGTINGFGERCGNANLTSIIPNLKLKLKLETVNDRQLRMLQEVSNFVNEMANMPPYIHAPYVGKSAFAHKGGMHVDAMRKNPLTYEHVRPEWVGNRRRILVSDLSGRSNITEKAEEFGLELRQNDPVTAEILNQLKDLEHQGYQFEGAEASFELLVNRAMGRLKKYFDLIGFRVIDLKREENEPPMSEATIRVRVGGLEEHTAANGNGPVNALDNALRKSLEKFYPQLRDVSLHDYKVRVLPSDEGTSSRVRVLIESGDAHDHWGTVGVSSNIIEASWQALADSIVYKLFKDEARSGAISEPK